MPFQLQFKVPAHPTAPREARRRLDALAPLAPAAMADARLIVSELVTNAMLHGDLAPDDPIEVAVSVMDTHLIIAVGDHGRFSRTALTPRRRDGGFGLRIVSALSDHWDARAGRVTARVSLAGYGGTALQAA